MSKPSPHASFIAIQSSSLSNLKTSYIYIPKKCPTLSAHSQKTSSLLLFTSSLLLKNKSLQLPKEHPFVHFCLFLQTKHAKHHHKYIYKIKYCVFVNFFVGILAQSKYLSYFCSMFERRHTNRSLTYY